MELKDAVTKLQQQIQAQSAALQASCDYLNTVIAGIVQLQQEYNELKKSKEVPNDVDASDVQLGVPETVQT